MSTYLLPTREELQMRDLAREQAAALAAVLRPQTDLLEDAVQYLTNRIDIEAENEHGKWQPIGTSYTASRTDELIYNCESDLQKIRTTGRRLTNFNPFAINLIGNGQAYIVGTGHAIKIKRKEGMTEADVSDDVLERCREIVKKFEQRNKWAERQDETWMRGERDGDILRRLFVSGSDLYVRFIEPEQLRNPTEINPADLTTGAVQYGVRFRELEPAGNRRGNGQASPALVDYESPVAYYIHRLSASPLVTVDYRRPADELPAFDHEELSGEIQHIKFNVDMAAPRGVSTFWAIEEFLERAVKNLRSMSTVVGIQAAIAMVRKHARATQATIQSYVANMADAAVTSSLTQKTLNYSHYKPGTILDVPETVDYQFPGVQVDVTRIVAAVQAELRAAAARVQYPEFMLTSDPSGAPYSAVLVAEGPVVKKFERCQQRMIEWDKPVIRLQLAIKADARELPRNILDVVDIEIEAPRVKTRNLGEEVTSGLQLVEKQIISESEFSGGLGYEYEKSQAAIDEELERKAERQKKFGPPTGEAGSPADGPALSKEAPPSGSSPTKPPTKPKKEAGAARELAEPEGASVAESVELEEAEGPRYSCLLAELPAPVAKSIQAVGNFIPAGILAEKGRETEPHVTVKYGFTFDDARRAKQALLGQEPITATLGKISLFHQPEYDVVKVEVESPALHALHDRMNKLPNVSTHPTYQPHVTLAYVKPGTGDEYDGLTPFVGIPFTLDKLLFSDTTKKQTVLFLSELAGEQPVSFPESEGPVQNSTPTSEEDDTVLEALTAILPTHPGGWEIIEGVPVWIDPVDPDDSDELVPALLEAKDSLPEGGAWRTINGVPVYIKDGQALTGPLKGKAVGDAPAKKDAGTKPKLVPGKDELFTKEERALPAKKDHPFHTESQVYKTAEKVKDLFDNLLDHGKGVDKLVGGKSTRSKEEVEAVMKSDQAIVMLAPLKGKSRAKQKVEDKYGGDWGKLHDVVRATVGVTIANDIPTALDAIRSQMSKNGWSLAVAPEDRIKNPCPGGYRDIQLKLVSPEGMFVELQVNTKAMLRAKDIGHKLYEDVRVIKEKALAEGRQLTATEYEQVQGAEKQMEELYAKAWEDSQ